MNNQSLISLVKESRPLLANSTPQQKIRLIKLIKECLKKSKSEKTNVFLLNEHNDSDYLPET
jgi:hypothetical protein